MLSKKRELTIIDNSHEVVNTILVRVAITTCDLDARAVDIFDASSLVVVFGTHEEYIAITEIIWRVNCIARINTASAASCWKLAMMQSGD